MLRKGTFLTVVLIGLGILVLIGLGIFRNTGLSFAVDGSNKSPIIKCIEWGKIVVSHNGQEFCYCDCKLWPNHSKEWNWNETGTHHDPGIQCADLEEFIDDVDIVILTRGMQFMLQVSQEIIDYVKSRKKECHVGKTDRMVELYNKLVKEGKKVGGLFHSTC